MSLRDPEAIEYGDFGRVGHGVGAELLEPAAGLTAREAGREQDILRRSLRSDWVSHNSALHVPANP